MSDSCIYAPFPDFRDRANSFTASMILVNIAMADMTMTESEMVAAAHQAELFEQRRLAAIQLWKNARGASWTGPRIRKGHTPPKFEKGATVEEMFNIPSWDCLARAPDLKPGIKEWLQEPYAMTAQLKPEEFITKFVKVVDSLQASAKVTQGRKVIGWKDLPVEIETMIWMAACDIMACECRIQWTYDDAKFGPGFDSPTAYRNSRMRSMNPYPNIFHVNRASRYIAQTYSKYVPAFGGEGGRLSTRHCAFRFATDTLFFQTGLPTDLEHMILLMRSRKFSNFEESVSSCATSCATRKSSVVPLPE